MIDQHSLAVKQAITRLCCILDYYPHKTERKERKSNKRHCNICEMKLLEFVENAASNDDLLN